MRWPLSAALLASKIPLEARWDALVPATWEPGPELALMKEILAALPEKRRNPALKEMLLDEPAKKKR